MYLKKNQVLLLEHHSSPICYRIVTQTMIANTRQKRAQLVDEFNRQVIPYLYRNFEQYEPERDKCFLPIRGENRRNYTHMYINIPYGQNHQQAIKDLEDIMSQCVANLSSKEASECQNTK